MNKIEDERLKFYLRNVRLIKEWADLGGEVCDVVDRFLVSLVEDIESLAGEIDSEIIVYTELESGWPKIFLQFPHWNTAGGKMIIAGIGLEWDRKVDLVSHLPYIGTWIDPKHEKADSIRDAVHAKSGTVAPDIGFKKGRSRFWPAFKNLEPEGEFWEDLEPFRQTVIEEMRQIWNLFGTVVDEALTREAGGIQD